jgi:hypothetical protein
VICRAKGKKGQQKNEGMYFEYRDVEEQPAVPGTSKSSSRCCCCRCCHMHVAPCDPKATAQPYKHQLFFTCLLPVLLLLYLPTTRRAPGQARGVQLGAKGSRQRAAV